MSNVSDHYGDEEFSTSVSGNVSRDISNVDSSIVQRGSLELSSEKDDGFHRVDDGMSSVVNCLPLAPNISAAQCSSPSTVIVPSSGRHRSHALADVAASDSGPAVDDEHTQQEDVLARRLGLPRRPVAPDEQDCCHSGCDSCVFDVYHRRLSAWRQRLASSVANSDPIGDDVEGANDDDIRDNGGDNGAWCIIDQVTQLSSFGLFIYRFVVESQVEEGERTSRLLPPPLAGHLLAREQRRLTSDLNEDDGDDVFVERAFTPITHPHSARLRHCFDVCVRVYDDGRMSRLVASRWRRGHRVWWRPAGTESSGSRARLASLITTLSTQTAEIGGGRSSSPDCHCRLLLLLAGGTGAAPLVQIARHLTLTLTECEVHVRLVVCARHLCCVLARNELLTQLACYWNFECRLFISGGRPLTCEACCDQCVLSKPERHTGTPGFAAEQNAPPGYGERIEWRRVAFNDLTSFLLVGGENLAGTARVIVCGPVSFCDDMWRHLLAAGCNSDNMIRL